MEPIDGITSASKTFYYEKSSFTNEVLFEKINEHGGEMAITVATVNEDNSPNLAVLIPKVASKEHLVFGVSDNQTRKNLLLRKKAMLAVYSKHPESDDKLIQNQGARVLLILEEDSSTLQELRNKFPQPRLIFMRILRVLPLG